MVDAVGRLAAALPSVRIGQSSPAIARHTAICLTNPAAALRRVRLRMGCFSICGEASPLHIESPLFSIDLKLGPDAQLVEQVFTLPPGTTKISRSCKGKCVYADGEFRDIHFSIRDFNIELLE